GADGTQVGRIGVGSGRAYPPEVSVRLRYCPLRRGITERLSWDSSQEVCPWNSEKFVGIGVRAETRARAGARAGGGDAPARPRPLGGSGAVSGSGLRGSGTGAGAGMLTGTGTGTEMELRLVDLMGMDEAAWDAFSRGSAIRRAKRAGFLR